MLQVAPDSSQAIQRTQTNVQKFIYNSHDLVGLCDLRLHRRLIPSRSRSNGFFSFGLFYFQ